MEHIKYELIANKNRALEGGGGGYEIKNQKKKK